MRIGASLPARTRTDLLALGDESAFLCAEATGGRTDWRFLMERTLCASRESASSQLFWRADGAFDLFEGMFCGSRCWRRTSSSAFLTFRSESGVFTALRVIAFCCSCQFWIMKVGNSNVKGFPLARYSYFRSWISVGYFKFTLNLHVI